MAAAVIMPRQGQSVESCIITKWNKKKGERVSIGDVLFSYETDKAAFDEEARTEGVLLAVFFEEGDDVPCLENVCVIGEEGENISAFMPDNGDSTTDDINLLPSTNKRENLEANISVIESAVAAVTDGGRLKISPRARALAERCGADAHLAVPTGANGRLIERDIERVIAEGKLVTSAAKAGYTPGSDVVGTGVGGRVTTADLKNADVQAKPVSVSENEFEVVPLSGIRKVIARTMHDSLANSAQLTLHTSFDATDMMTFRKRVKETESLPPVSPTDIIVYTTARVLLKHKSLNAHFLGDKMHIYSAVHMGVATDTPRGLMVPTVFNADCMALSAVSSKIKELAGLCRQGSVSPDLLTGGTFTISNLGAFGIESFTPVLNPPQTGLLGVCSITERTKNGRTYPAMGLSLTFDHRALDGADAARFLKELVESLESFSLLAALY